MVLVQLYIQIEAAHDTVDELGKLGLIQFRDLNPEVNAFQRNFVNEVKRADEMERKLRFFEEQLRKAGVWNIKERPGNIRYEEYVNSTSSEEPLLMDKLEIQLEEIERELIQLNANQETLDRNHNELIELRHVLDKDSSFFGYDSGGQGAAAYSEQQPLVQGEDMGSPLSFITGVVLRSKMSTFERVLWRAMRGNLFIRQAEIEEPIRDPATGEYQEKNVFIILYRGERSETKIRKLCEAFGANLYPCPHSANERMELRNDIDQRLLDLSKVLERTESQNKRTLSNVLAEIERWQMEVLKEKSIYHTMNLFNYDTGRRCLVAEGWCPEDQNDIEQIRRALDRGNQRSGASVPSILSVIEAHDAPPTYFVTNRFTSAFQNLVESYGVARYREINPAVFTVITFPFLFGVMFGDVGHGIILLFVGLYLCLKERQLERIKLPEMVDTLFEGRWLFLLMSLFAIYCGALYNEFFGITMDIFGTNWTYGETIEEHDSAHQISVDRAYPFGADPLWKGANNELDYYNSLKMKMSVIMGVVHMTVGICLSFLNQIYFRQYLSVFYEFFPQMVFLLGLFGFMDALIIFKWLNDWRDPQYSNYGGPGGFIAPRLLNLLINMFLSPFEVAPQYNIINGQLIIQWIVIFLTFSSVPLMLLAKPLIMKYYAGKRQAPHYTIVGEGSDGSDHGHHEEEFVFSEALTHQGIHTIEFVLGAVSNTASYLRLWALSLAHAELSIVFWERVMVFTLQKQGVIPIFIGWSIWAALTVAVLLVMESLSAFLHALRLHWVEFQNKFYKGDGHKFVPFSYEGILVSGEEM